MGVYKTPNIVLVGDPQVGKSTLISKCHESNSTLGEGGFFTRPFEFPTIYQATSFKTYRTDMRLFGINHRHMQYITNGVFQANIIDTGGSSRYDEIRPLAYINSDVFVMCFDLTNSTSLENVQSKWLPEIRKYEPYTPIILLGNKADLKEEQVIGNEAHKLCKTLGLDRYIEISCLDNNNVSMVFGGAVDLAVGRRQKLELRETREKAALAQEEFDISGLAPASDPPEYPKKGSTTLCKATLNSSSLTDVILRFPGGSPDINAHRFILILASGAFKRLLTNATSPTETVLEHSATANNTKQQVMASSTQGNHTNTFQRSSRTPSDVLLDGLPFLEIQHEQELEENCTNRATDAPCQDKLKITFDTSIDYKAFMCVLKWMYTGSLDINGITEDGFVEHLYQTVLELEIRPLKVVCRRLLKHKRKMRNFKRKHADVTRSLTDGNQALQADENVLPLLQPPADENSDQEEASLNDTSIPASPPLESFEMHISPSRRNSFIPAPPSLDSLEIYLNEKYSSTATDTNDNTKAESATNDACNAYQDMWRTADECCRHDCLTDTVLVVEDTSIPVHRVVMVTRSRVLAAMLDGSFKERNRREIKLPGISLEHFRTVLEFMYTDKCVLDGTNANGVLELADRFCVQSLADRCEEFLIFTYNKLTRHPAERVAAIIMESIYLSKVYNTIFLYEWCLHFVATNYYLFERGSVSAMEFLFVPSLPKERIASAPKPLWMKIEELFQTVWSEVEEFVEKNRWPPRKYLQVLHNYKMKSRHKKDVSSFSNKQLISNNYKCCAVM